MTSEPTTSRASRAGGRPGVAGTDPVFVWVWLPGETTPVVAGSLTRTGRVFAGDPVLLFTYARSYRARPGAISLWTDELPLTEGVLDPTDPEGIRRRGGTCAGVERRSPLSLAGCLRDAAPDAWGRRVLDLRLAGNPEADLSELTYLLASGSNRVGALDFQASPTEYVTRDDAATLEQLTEVAGLIEAGAAIPEDLAAAAGHGTSIGGARPKALLRDGQRQLIAKFSSSTDTRPVVQAEGAAMLLAARVGLDVAPVEVVTVAGTNVLLVERFDRAPGGPNTSGSSTRRLMLSALTVLGRGEHESRYASYADLADVVRLGPFLQVQRTLRELFTRLVFNVCTGNNDDHLRNHAAFWDGEHLQLTPAYDLAPQPRSTDVSTQAIGVTRDGRRNSQLWLCREAAADLLIAPGEADAIIDLVVTTIEKSWDEVCDEVRLTRAERGTLMGREFLNRYIHYPET